MPSSRRDREVDDTTSGAAALLDDGYRWVALANTTASVFMSALDSDARVFYGTGQTETPEASTARGVALSLAAYRLSGSNRIVTLSASVPVKILTRSRA
jgi:hypothetical protein